MTGARRWRRSAWPRPRLCRFVRLRGRGRPTFWRRSRGMDAWRVCRQRLLRSLLVRCRTPPMTGSGGILAQPLRAALLLEKSRRVLLCPIPAWKPGSTPSRRDGPAICRNHFCSFGQVVRIFQQHLLVDSTERLRRGLQSRHRLQYLPTVLRWSLVIG